MERPGPDQTFIAEIDRISGSGNGIIQLEDTHINIGPVTGDSVGKEIKATMLNGTLACCHTDDVKGQHYKKKFLWMIEGKGEKGEESGLVGKTVVVKPTRRESGITDHPAVNIQGKEILIKRADLGRKVKIKIQSEGENKAVASVIDLEPREPIRKEPQTPESEKPEPDHTEELDVTESESLMNLTSESEQDSLESTGPDKVAESSPENPPRKKGQTSVDETTESSDQATNHVERSKSKEYPSKKDRGSISDQSKPEDEKMEQLRQKANRDAREEVPTSTTIQQTTQEYTRSQAIKKYVKKRSNGYCEGCGKPAPFTSKTDDPYLHAHHIHELSDGGSDTPDTVIALCPNCHYRVHHGKDGEEYNQQLLEIVQEIEREFVD